MADMREWIPGEMTEDEKQGFVIDNDELAEWAILKIRARIEERDRLTDVCDKMIAHYQEAKAEEDRKCENEIGFLRGKLFEYSHGLKMKETKTQLSYKLPSGSLVVKKAKVKMEHDDDVLLQFLKDSGNIDFVKVTEKPDWAAVKSAITVEDGQALFSYTGEVVPGITMVEEPESFEVKV